MASSRQMLTCWKEIAQFFGKSVRTVQRWEEIGLPVHRPTGKQQVIFADPEELHSWALRALGGMPENPLHERCTQLVIQSRETVKETRQLIAESRALIETLKNRISNTFQPRI